MFEGQHIIPTPFLTTLPVAVVMSELRERNPEKLVTSDPPAREVYAREAHKRLGIAYRPNEARRFA